MGDTHIHHKLRPYISAEEIKTRVEQMADSLTKDFVGLEDKTVILCILKGAFVFLADLIRNMPISIPVEFCRASSYHDEIESQGKVDLILPPLDKMAGKFVIIVEDIVDTGITMNALVRELERFGVKKAVVCALLSKPSKRKIDVKIHYLGFEVPDLFIVGYGLDYASHYRNLDHLAVVQRTDI
ncbi:MAG: hypoxanthine phosphoribosyltransferase [Candidatus Brocadiia bacterium]